MNAAQEIPPIDRLKEHTDSLGSFSRIIQESVQEVATLVRKYVDTFSEGMIGPEDREVLTQMNGEIAKACETCASEISASMQDLRIDASPDERLGVVFGMLWNAVESEQHANNMFHGIELQNAYRKIATAVRGERTTFEVSGEVRTQLETFSTSTAASVNDLVEQNRS